MATLTPRQQRFVEEYLVDLNATQAAIRAGYSLETADVQGPRLLGNVGVAEAISAAKADRSRRTGITAERVLQELAALAFSDLGDYVAWDENGVRVRPSSEVDTRAVLEVRQTVTKDGGSRSIKLHDKLGALVTLGRHLGMFEQRVALANANSKPFRVEDVVLSDDERAARIADLLDRARARAAIGTPP
jgi:phage terminase small subunit